MKAILGKLNDERLDNLARHSRPYCRRVDAAVAYAQGGSHPLVAACRDNDQHLTFYGLLDDTGAVGVDFLKSVINLRSSAAYLLKGNFHAKVIWWRGFGAYVGSANATDKAWHRNVEAGVFLTEDELAGSEIGADLDGMFEHLASNAVRVSPDTLPLLEKLEQRRHAELDKAQGSVRRKFEELFGHIPANESFSAGRASSSSADRARDEFVREWHETLALIRAQSQKFADLGVRPNWVDGGAHDTVVFDQFLHSYYYSYVRQREPEEGGASSVAKVEASHERNRHDPDAALRHGAEWWAGLDQAPYGEDDFIRQTAADMRSRFAPDAVRSMDMAAFREAIRQVNAFREHARQVRNSTFGLPKDHKESADHRADRLAEWLWLQRSSDGRTVRDVLEFVLWADFPATMEQRLWQAVRDEKYKIPHFGYSTLGETVGWARPDTYPPRNDRTNKALRALGFDVKLFAEAT